TDPGLPEGYEMMLSKQPARWAEALGISTTISSEVALPDNVDEGAEYSGTNPKVLATQHSSIVQKDYTSETSNAAVRDLTITQGGHFLPNAVRSEEHTSELQSRENLVCRLLLEKKKMCFKTN